MAIQMIGESQEKITFYTIDRCLSRQTCYNITSIYKLLNFNVPACNHMT